MPLEITFRCLALKVNYKLAYRFVGVPDQGMKPSTFNKFELGRPDMTQKCFLHFCDGSVPQCFRVYVRKALFIALWSLVSLVSIQKN